MIWFKIMSRERQDRNIVLTYSSVYDKSRRGRFDIPEIQKKTNHLKFSQGKKFFVWFHGFFFVFSFSQSI